MIIKYKTAAINSMKKEFEELIQNLNELAGFRVHWTFEDILKGIRGFDPGNGKGFSDVFDVGFSSTKENRFMLYTPDFDLTFAIDEYEGLDEYEDITFASIYSDLRVDFSHATIGDGEDPLSLFDIRVDSISEVVEVFEFLLNLESEELPTLTYRQISLYDVLEDLELVFSRNFEEPLLLESSKITNDIAKLVVKFFEIRDFQFSAYDSDGLETANSLVCQLNQMANEFSKIGPEYSKRDKRNSVYFDSIRLKFLEDKEFIPWSDVLGWRFKISKKYSKMCLSDLMSSQEAIAAFEILGDPRTTVKKLKNTKIRIPSSKLLQQYEAINRRMHKRLFQDYLVKLENETFSTNASKLNEAVELRTKLLKNLSGEVFNKFAEWQNPLPVFLERAYLAFGKESPADIKCQNGEKLLNILLKTGLFFILESFGNLDNYKTGHSEISNIKNKSLQHLRSKKCSDGDYAQLLRNASKIEIQFKGPFRELASVFIENDAVISSLLAARNRRHHAPFDSIGFIAIFSELMPDLIRYVRRSLEPFEMAFVTSFKNTKGVKEVEGINFKMADAIPETKRWQTDHSLDVFQTESVLIFSEDCLPIALHGFFDVQSNIKTVFEIGILDRFNGEDPVFNYY